MQVTQVTANATIDPLTDQDYRDIFDELHDKGISLETFIEMAGSQYSKAQWSKYARNLIPLNRAMKADLRRAVSEKTMPLTVAEATSTADPDAAVWQVGKGAAAHVIMVSATPVTLHVNGSVQIIPSNTIGNARVTEGTGARRGDRYRFSLYIPKKYSKRLEGLRNGLTPLQIFERGLEVCEQECE